MLLTGMGLVLIAVAVAYFGTPIRNEIPVGVLVAVLLLASGLFLFALAPYFRGTRYAYLDDGYVERRRYVDEAPTTASTTIVRERPVRRARSYVAPVDDLDRETETIETTRVH